MPLLRYFVVAGTGLLLLLFVVSAYLPAPVTRQSDANALDKTTIRINGDKPVAERVTIDTSLPTITPAVVAAAAVQEETQDDSKRNALARMEDAPPPVAAVVTPPPARVKKVAIRKRPRRSAVVLARPTGFFDLW